MTRLISRREWFAYVALFIVALGLRAATVERPLFWHDEVFTQVFAAGHQSADWLPLFDSEVRDVSALRHFRAYDPSKTLVDTTFALARDEPQHPPLFYVAARAWAGALDDPSGRHDVTQAGARLRWLSLLAGTLAFFAMVWWGRELFADARRRVALVALYACSPFFVLYAQEAREYTAWTCFAVLSSAALLRARRVGALASYATYAFVLALGFYTSLSMATVALGHALFVAVRESSDLRRTRRPSRALALFTAAGVVAALLFAPWAVLFARHYEAFRASMAWSRDIVIPHLELLGSFALNLSRGFIDLGVDEAISGATVVGLVILVGMVAMTSLNKREAWMALSLFAGPVVMLLMPDLLTGGIRSISTRYLIPCHLALLIAAAGVVRAGPRSYLVAGLVCAGLLSSAFNATRTTPWTKGVSRRLPEVAALINETSGALVVANHERHHPGNVLALSGLVDDGTQLQLLPTVEDYVLPEHPGEVYLLSPSPRFVAELRESAGVDVVPRLESLHTSLWQVRRRR